MIVTPDSDTDASAPAYPAHASLPDLNRYIVGINSFPAEHVLVESESTRQHRTLGGIYSTILTDFQLRWRDGDGDGQCPFKLADFESFFFDDYMLFSPSLIAKDDSWHGPLLDNIQIHVGKICFYFRLDINILCMKNINGSWHFCVYQCSFNAEAIEAMRSVGDVEWLDQICKRKWISVPCNKEKCLSCIRYGTTELTTRNELEELLNQQSGSALTLGLVSAEDTENESVFFLNFSSAPCPLNEDIMARVKHVIGGTEEGGQASVPSLDEGIKARSLGNDL